MISSSKRRGPTRGAARGSRRRSLSRSLHHFPKLVAVEEEASLPPPPRPAYHAIHAAKRAPSYLFVFIHLCYVYSLVEAIYSYIIVPSLAHMEAPDVGALWSHMRGMTPELLMHALFPPQETSRWWQVRPRARPGGKLTKQIIVRQLWRSPSTMFFLFGSSYFAANAIIMMLRIMYCSGRYSLRLGRRFLRNNTRTKERRSSNQGEGGGTLVGASVSMYTMCRYGNGYDSILRLIFSLTEIAWFMRFIHGFGLQNSPADSRVINIDDLPLPQLSVEVSQWALILAMELVLVLAAVLDVQRLFHALVGVRPLTVPNGYESCPLCEKSWKVTRRTANRVHVCPELWVPSSMDDGGSNSHCTSASSSACDEFEEPPETLLLANTDSEERPGDAFPDPNNIHWWTRLTYSWLSPVLNMALLSPFGTFSSPPAEAFKDGGSALWRAQLAVVARLPRLPDCLATRGLGDEAWTLWKTRRRNAAEEAALASRRSSIERAFLWVTAPVRHVLTVAFCAYFLPPPASHPSIVPDSTKESPLLPQAEAKTGKKKEDDNGDKSHKNGRKREGSTAASGAAAAVPPPAPPADKRSRKGLFSLFLEHSSGREYVYACVPLKLVQDLLSLVTPHMLRALVLFLREVGTAVATSAPHRRNGHEEYLPSPGESYLGRGLLVCGGLLLVVFLQGLLFQAYLDHLYASSLKAATSLKYMLLRRTLETPMAYSNQAQATSDGDDSSATEDETEESDDSRATPLVPEDLVLPRATEGDEDGEAEQSLAQSTMSIVMSPTLAVSGSPRSHPRGRLRSKGPASMPIQLPPRQQTDGATAADSKSTLTGEGEVISLVTVDASACGDTLIFLHNVWGHPMLIITSLLNMYTYVGWFSTMVTFAVLVAATPLNKQSAANVRHAQQKAKDGGSRLKVLGTAITAMRTVKAMALEKCLMLRIGNSRASESEGSKSVVRAESLATAQTELITLGISLACFGSYLLNGGKMDAAVMVPTMAALGVMRYPLWNLPHLFSQVSRGYAALQRIEHFLEREATKEKKSGDNIREDSPLGSDDGESPLLSSLKSLPIDLRSEAAQTGAVYCDGWHFSWARPERYRRRTANGSPHEAEQAALNMASSPTNKKSEAIVLTNIHVDVKPGEFVVIHGPTGSGKTAMLLAILGELWPISARRSPSIFHLDPAAGGEMRSLSGRMPSPSRKAKGFSVGGRIAYCAEIPWLRNQTVRENIRLLPDEVPETTAEREFYERVLSACALTRDLLSMPLGDRTVVGEGGSRLSGGQRARVALARAVLRRDETDVYLLDDVLSALDVEVQKHLISEVLRGILQEITPENPHRKTIILSTHVAAEMIMPDRLYSLQRGGYLREVRGFMAPTAEHIENMKEAWRIQTAANAASPRGNRHHVVPSGEEVEKLAPTTTGAVPAKPSATSSEPVATIFNTKRFTLLPNMNDLRTLFVTYMGPRRAFIVLVLALIAQVLQTFTDNWLGIWISLHRDQDEEQVSFRTTLLRLASLPIKLVKGEQGTNSAMIRELRITSSSWYGAISEVAYYYLVTSQDAVVLQFLCSFALVGLVAATFSFIRTRTFFLSFQRVSDALQLRAVGRIFGAPASYFDCIPTSGLLQVLSRDQEVVDHSLAESVQMIFLTVLQLFAMVCFNTMQHSAFIVVVPLSGLLFYHLTLRFLLLTKQVRTLESRVHARSINIVKEAVRGAVSIRAYGAELHSQIDEEMVEALDAVHAAAHIGLTADRWVALRLELVSLIMTGTLSLLAVFSVCFSERGSARRVNVAAISAAAAYAGLGVTSSLSAARSFSLLCRRIGMFQTQYVSAEQLLMLQRDIPEEPMPPLEESSDDSCTDSDATEVDAVVDELVSNTSSLTAAAPIRMAEAILRSRTRQARPVLEVRHLSAKYQPHLPWVLHDVDLKLFPGECVGLIGRTGNGKSSLFNALLQLMDVVQGELWVRDTSTGERVPRRGRGAGGGGGGRGGMRDALHMNPIPLRRHFFQLVSQEPFLMEGTCRSNLLLGLEEEAERDGEAMEERMRAAIEKVELDALLSAPSPSLTDATATTTATDEEESPMAEAAPTLESLLDFPIAAGGSNLSAGQRQLLCLARALLHKPQVVLLDEISSRVDGQTDLLIQRIVKEEFLGRKEPSLVPSPPLQQQDGSPPVGVLLIAHRLETIMSLCDRVVVVERGCCVADLTIEEVSSLEDLESYL